MENTCPKSANGATDQSLGWNEVEPWVCRHRQTALKGAGFTPGTCGEYRYQTKCRFEFDFPGSNLSTPSHRRQAASGSPARSHARSAVEYAADAAMAVNVVLRD